MNLPRNIVAKYSKLFNKASVQPSKLDYKRKDKHNTLETTMLTLLKFSSSSCTPCKILDEQLSKLDLSNFNYQSIDIQEHTDLAIKHKIRSVPTLILLDNNSELKRHIGGLTPQQLETFLT